MPQISKITGVERVIAKLRARIDRIGPDENCLVGYTQSYAIFVHENLQAHHPVGQAKYLEQPFREMQGELADTVENALVKGRSIGEALLLAGLKLQRASQQLVPVDTGALKGSAFTRLE